MRSVEAGESASSHGVLAEDRWTGEGGLAVADPEAIVEGGGSGAVPGSDAAPREAMEGSSSGAAPLEARETSPPMSEQGGGLKRSRPPELEQGSGGSSPKCTR